MTGIYLFVVAIAATAIANEPGEVGIYPVPQYCPPETSTSNVVHIAHPDCTKFCSCGNGNAYVMECPYDPRNGVKLHFNKVLQICDHPWHANCDGKGVTSGVCGGNPKPEPKPEPEPAPKPKPEPSCVTCAPGCDGVTFPHEYVPYMYYECKHGILLIKYCTKGQVWDKEEKKCKEA